MSIRLKIYLPVLGAVLLGLIMCGFVVFQANNGVRNVTAVMDQVLSAKHDTETLRNNFARVHELTDRVILSSENIPAEQVRAEYNSAVGPLTTAIDSLGDLEFSGEMNASVQAAEMALFSWMTESMVALGIRQRADGSTPEVLAQREKALQTAIEAVSAQAASEAVRIREAASADMRQALMMALAIAIAVSIAGAIAGFVIARSLSRPLLQLVKTAERLAAGETSVAFSQQSRKDEIGAVARAIAGFRDGIEKRQAMEKVEQQIQYRQERQKRRDVLIEDFHVKAERLLGSVASRMLTMEERAQGMTHAADRTSESAAEAAAASDVASGNVQSIATAATEMAKAVSETFDQIERASDHAADAAICTEDSDGKVTALAESAQQISKIVSLIQDIAEQTNLLALNATIEAAPAGDAGRGFAVVASEVKQLANQTAKATDDIATEIAGIQSSSDGVVSSIRSVASVVEQVNAATAAIRERMDQQRGAVEEITRNMENASEGSARANSNIEIVSGSISQTSETARVVADVASSAAQDVGELRQAVETFLERVRAA